MGSIGIQNSWAPYDSYRDCSRGICSIYCPQWCYIVFPPPPPFGPPDDDSRTNFSPLIIAVIAILASTFILVSYYTIISKYCRRRRDRSQSEELEANRNQANGDQWQVASAGLEETLIKSIPVCKYKKGDGSVEGTECAVCLSEFQEDDSLRLMPKCNHAFHLPCIDTWLKSHTNCPLCRSNIASANPQPIPAPSSQSSSTLSISSLETHRQNDVILVVDDRERSYREEASVGLVCSVFPKIPFQTSIVMRSSEVRQNTAEIGGEGALQFRRSISLGSVPCQGHLLVADILQINEDDEDFHMELCQYPLGIGSSKRLGGEHSRTGDRSGQ